MRNWLQPDLTTLAFCWRLARADGVTLGFTSHDRDVVMGGLPYRSAPGMVPAAIESADGFAAGASELRGALTSSAIRQEDIEAGRWAGAKMWLYAVNWEDPDDAPLLLAKGSFGAIEQQDDAFSVELVGPLQALEREVAPVASPTCRARLGDQACRVDMASRIVRARIIAANDAALTLDANHAGGVFAFGNVRFLEGENAGLRFGIIAHSGAVVTLAEPPPFVPEVNTPILLTQGCDGRFATCRDRFANSVNFRGEPHLPGNDLLTRYVAA